MNASVQELESHAEAKLTQHQLDLLSEISAEANHAVEPQCENLVNEAATELTRRW